MARAAVEVTAPVAHPRVGPSGAAVDRPRARVVSAINSRDSVCDGVDRWPRVVGAQDADPVAFGVPVVAVAVAVVGVPVVAAGLAVVVVVTRSDENDCQNSKL